VDESQMESGSVNRKHITKRHHRGFTLVEILVTSVMAGVMVMGFLTVTVDFFKRDSSQRQQITGQQQLRLAAQVIAADIRKAGYIYTDPTTAANLIAGAAVSLPAGTTPKLAVLIPYQLNGTPDATSRFQLVIYATGSVPTVAPFNSVATLRGNVIYRWSSDPEFFDPRTQKQGVNGDGNAPSALNSGFLTYNANGGAAPPILVGNINTLTLGSPTTATFGDFNSDTGKNLTMVGYQDPDVTKTDQVKGPARVSSFLQARNLGIPPSPLPGYTGSTGGVRGNCSASNTCYGANGAVLGGN
jgi:prepilin-type N-terminal cleavage/methylation domain-containing protein